MLSVSEKAIRNHLARFKESIPPDVLADISRVTGYSMLPLERLYDLYMTVAQLRRRDVPGDIVEFGVWKGGGLACATLAATRTPADPLAEGIGPEAETAAPSAAAPDWSFLTRENRKLFGFDTFSGHSAPKDWEKDVHGKNQHEVYKEVMTRDGEWAAVSREDVAANLATILGKDVHKYLDLIAGDAVQTSVAFSETARNRKIALLRLDMDWYDPTVACLQHLVPHIPPFGVMILDDFGHHNGVQKAIAEYFAASKRTIEVSKVDYSCMRITFLD